MSFGTFLVLFTLPAWSSVVLAIWTGCRRSRLSRDLLQVHAVALAAFLIATSFTDLARSTSRVDLFGLFQTVVAVGLAVDLVAFPVIGPRGAAGDRPYARVPSLFLAITAAIAGASAVAVAATLVLLPGKVLAAAASEARGRPYCLYAGDTFVRAERFALLDFLARRRHRMRWGLSATLVVPGVQAAEARAFSWADGRFVRIRLRAQYRVAERQADCASRLGSGHIGTYPDPLKSSPGDW